MGPSVEQLKGNDDMSQKNSKRMALIASKGTLDWAYPPFILASTAAAMDMEVGIFFTFYGLTLLKKKISAKVLLELLVMK